MTSATDWEGTVGDTWAAEWRRTDRGLADLSRHLDAAIVGLAPPDTFRALDIGCGAGGTSLALATTRSDAHIVGVDLSEALVDVARERAAASAPDLEITFVVGDAAEVAAERGPFDLLYSRHGIMFFDDPVGAFIRLRKAAPAGGKLVFSCFADWSANSFASDIAAAVGAPPPVPGAPGPFAFQDEDHVTHVLLTAGWRDPTPALISFTYRAGEGTGEAAAADALSFLQRIGPAASALRAASPDARARLLDVVAAVVERHYTRDAIDFPALAWIWSATA